VEWFAKPNEHTSFDESGVLGMRFGCTMCGNCCSGPEGFVLVTDAEAQALASRLGLDVAGFLSRYTRMTSAGRSLTERLTEAGNDCVFLDRAQIPGRGVCGVYEDRPAQCRTWPFWKSTLASRSAWEQASRRCPGMRAEVGTHYSVQQIRVLRDRVEI